MIGSTLWKETTKQAKHAGDEFLNVEFGWKPIVSDITEIIGAVRKARDVLQQYERDAGKVVRRRMSFPTITSNTTTLIHSATTASMPCSRMGQFQNGVTNPLYRQRSLVKKQWFSGSFTYHLPSDYYSRNKLMELGAKADVLFGTRLTPEIVWNAMPWSWAVDWFANLGDVFSNVSDWSSDGLVMRYGYIMEHCFVKDTYVLVGPSGFIPKGVLPRPVGAVFESKKRLAASPFGFGLLPVNFTDRQKAIITALGLTKWG
jgi:hypothetical protein